MGIYGAMDMLKKILKRMAERGMTQADLARVAAVEPARITEWKKSEWQPNVGQLARMSRHLGLSLDYLADDGLVEPPAPLSADDQTVLAVVHALDLSVSDVIRALNAATRATPSQTGGYAKVIVTRDLAESDWRREQEALAREAERESPSR
jgi:transcriptional regulator with XRE-family HTH domain